MQLPSVPHQIRASARRLGPKPAIFRATSSGPGEWTWLDIRNAVWNLARLLLSADVANEECVPILAGDDVDGLFAEAAVHIAGGTACILPTDAPPADLAYLLGRLLPVRLLASPDRVDAGMQIIRQAGLDIPILSLDFIDGALAAPCPADDDPEIDKALDRIGPERAATTLYSAGCLGPRRAAIIPMEALVLKGRAVSAFLGGDSSDVWMPLGRLCHPFIRATSWYAALASEGTMAICADAPSDITAMWALRPTIASCLAQDLESLASRIRAELERLDGFSGRVTRWAVSVEEQSLSEITPGRLLALRRSIAEPIRSAKARDVVGGNLRALTAGWSPVAQVPAGLLRAVGVEVFGCYGLAETAGVATLGMAETAHPQRLGPALPGLEFRVDQDSELQIRGPGLMRGYYSPGDDRPPYQGEWLATDDLADVDTEGRFLLAGKRKEIRDTP